MESFPDACTLLIDTYNTLNSGIINAIKVNNEILKPIGKELKGVRIDSGDLAYLSKEVRKILDSNGLKNTKIVVSNSLDEYTIASLLSQDAPIDSFGVGENMITSKSNPVFGGVYKLVAIEKDGKIIPKIKISDNIEKVTNPHFKHIYRLYDKNGKIIADMLTIFDEKIKGDEMVLVDPNKEWVKKTITDYKIKNIRKLIIENGKVIYEFPTINQTRDKVQSELNTVWEESKRLENPHTYIVNLSNNLKKLKENLLNTYNEKSR